VNYDGHLGYPTEIDFDGSVSVADDEVTFNVSDVREDPSSLRSSG
jgi:hypothetical protein